MKRVVLLLLLVVACRKPETPMPIPANGVALWLIADEAKPDAWTNPLVPGVDAKAASADERPAIVPNALNGHAVVRFDGENDMLKTSIGIGPTRMPDATIIAVFRSSTAERSPLRKLYGNDDGGFDRAVGLDDRAEAEKNYTLFTGMGVQGYFHLEADKTYVTVDQFSAKAFSGWVNGKATLTNIEAPWANEGLPNLYLGNTGTVFHEMWKGDLAEIIVYARHLTAEERARVEDYLAGRYQIALAR